MHLSDIQRLTFCYLTTWHDLSIYRPAFHYLASIPISFSLIRQLELRANLNVLFYGRHCSIGHLWRARRQLPQSHQIAFLFRLERPTSIPCHFCEFHPFPPLMVQLHPYQQILLSRTPSEENFHQFQTIRGLGSVLKALGLLLQMVPTLQSLLGHTQQPIKRMRFLMPVRRMCKLPRRLRSCARSHLP